MLEAASSTRGKGAGVSSWPPLIVVLGPTAVGKTELATRLGEALGAEIVSADSRQVYKYMDIGTAKPTPAQRRRVRHHLIDVVDPDEEYTLAQYKEMAYAAIDGLHAQGKLPLLVGGTGLYVRAVVEGWTVPRAKPDQELRAHLYARADQEGADAVHAELLNIDPVAASRIDARNVRRVIRALEVYITTGIPISELQKKHPPHYRVLRIGLTTTRERLYECIDERVDGMMTAGLLEEVRGLVARGYSYSLPSMSGLGYRQLSLYLTGEVSLDEAVQLIKRHTRRFVRQQYNWFRLSDESIQWYDVAWDCYGDVCALIRRFVSG